MKIYRVFYTDGFWADEFCRDMDEAWEKAREIGRRFSNPPLRVEAI